MKFDGFNGRSRLDAKLPLLALAVCVILPARALALAAPFQENFDGYANGAPPNNFVTAVNPGIFPGQASFSIKNPDGANGEYQHVLFGHNVNASAAISVTNLNHVDFTLSTTFILGTPILASLNDISVGLGALGVTPDFSVSGYHLSYATFSNQLPSGSLSIVRGGTYIAVNFNTLPVVIGATYTLTLQGTYGPTGLNLTGTVSNGAATLSVSGFDSNPFQGTYFGYYDTASGTVQTSVRSDVRYDNFSLSVPEPSALLLAVLGIFFLGFKFRYLRKA